MCVNYRAASREEVVGAFSARMDADLHWKEEIWKDYPAPIIRAADDGVRSAVLGTYGIVPRRHIPEGVHAFDTMNARSETVGEKRSFAKAWRSGQTCLVPMRCFFEPNYESGKAVRWGIKLVDHAPFAVAGLWREWNEEDGAKAVSFTQLTVNADDHPFMNRFHKPGAEKRALVIVHPKDYDNWLSCRDPEVARSFLTLYPPDLMSGWPEPQPSRSPSHVDAGKGNGSLF